jgi:ABC-type multidrug transport system fused ATPase/permease subunit
LRHPLLRLAPLFDRSKALLGVGISGLLVATALNLAGPWIVARAIDEDIAAGDREGLLGKALLYVGVLLANVVVAYASKMAVEITAQRAMYRLKNGLFDHLVDHDLAMHDKQSSGRLITRVQGDTEALRVLFSEVILQAPADLLLFTGMFAILSAKAPDVLLIVFGVVPPYVALFLLFRRISPPRFLRVRKVRSQMTGFFAEVLRAMPVLQGFGRAGWVVGRSDELNREVARTEAIAHLQPVWYMNAVVFIQRLGIVALLWVGAGRVADGVLTIGALIMALGYMRQMFDPLMRLSWQLTTIERARAAAARIAELLDTERRVADPPEPIAWPGLRTALRLEDVRFHYSPGTEVLRGLSIDVPAGSHVGVVGATGAGKSTVLNLLMRFADPTGGRLTVDGVDLRDLALHDLRGHVGLVLQDVHLFAGSLLDNLGGDRELAQRALDTLALPMPLDTVIGDGGGNLSRGERQLLTFARALVGDPELLVLDEATSAIDPATEARVQAALERLQEGRTTVTVAHRLATVRDCDCIYVLAAGEVAERGTHDELVAAGGLYAALQVLQHGRAA